MFVMTMAATFAIGDRAQVRINGEDATLYWRDAETLVINGTDARRIVLHETDGLDGACRPVQTFTCGDAIAKAEGR